jgi:hypothetical protein
MRIDLNQSAGNALAAFMVLRGKANGDVPMAIHGNPHEQWIHGNLEERVLVLLIITMLALSPILIVWWHW